MIKFALVCEDAHGFESWFPSGAAYESQVKRGLVLCPACGSIRVSKAIMAPAIATHRREAPQIEQSSAAAPPPSEAADANKPVVLLDERHAELREMIRGLRQKVLAETDDVGDRFSEEARRMHDGIAPERPIHGQATLEEAKALLEEGIGIMPLPNLPDDLN